MPTEPTPDAATGAETLTDILRDLEQEGYSAQQIVRSGGTIECTECGNESAPADFAVDIVRRLEGASDAADLLLIAASPCPVCEARGVMTLGYGPNTNDDDAAVMEALDLSGADHGAASPTSSRDADSTSGRQAGPADSRPTRKVLVGVDETPESREALRTAWEFFGPDADYTIACIHERQPFLVSGFGVGTDLAGMYATLDDNVGEHAAAKAAADVRTVVPDDADVSLHTDVGDAGTEIVNAAEEHGSDVIVIGSHDRNFWERLFTPSVGRFLVEHAPCPVLVVR